MVTLINIFMDIFINNLLFREKRRKRGFFWTKRLKIGVLAEKRKKRRSGTPVFY
jgi:hypothetical protein